MKLADLVSRFERLAPSCFAESWDNTGLLAGDLGRHAKTVLTTIDLTRAVLSEALSVGADVVYAYHPPLFKPIKRLVMPNVTFEAISRGIAIYSPHTALDVADGGTNDVLADACAMVSRRPLRMVPSPETHAKLVVFVPAHALDALSEAMFAAGAGVIGEYTHCSFRTLGTGTFFGNPSTNPAVGERGRLENVEETKVEVVVPLSKLDAVLAVMRALHPYEEPAYDLVRLVPTPEDRGIGRVGEVASTTLGALTAQLKQFFQVPAVLYVGQMDTPLSRVAVAAGSGADLLHDAITQRADAFVTGELRHHDALLAAEANIAVICLRHSVSERRALDGVVARLGAACEGVSFLRSAVDRDPFEFA